MQMLIQFFTGKTVFFITILTFQKKLLRQTAETNQKNHFYV